MSASLSLATRALRGFLWNGSASVIQLGVMLALYALLPLEDLGHFEWALALVMLLSLVGDLGLGAALIQLPSASEEHFDTAFWTCLSWGLLLTAAVVAASSWLAPFLGGEDPQTFSRVLSTFCLAIPFASLAGLLRARLQRNLDFRAVALSELVSVLTFAFAVTLLLFWRPELGVLVPVIGSVVRELGLFSSLALSARWLPRLRFRPQALRQILGFALHFTGSRTVAFLNTKIAYLFIYIPLGPTAQAYYSLAERLTLLPLTRLATTIQRVSFPTFSTIVEDNSLLAPRLSAFGTRFSASARSTLGGDFRLRAGDCRLTRQGTDVESAALFGGRDAVESRGHHGQFAVHGQGQSRLVLLLVAF